MKASTSLPVHQVFKALAHPARVAVVQALSDGGERCVCDLVEGSGLGWSTMSRHLAVLREAGILEEERRGQQIFNRLRLTCIPHFLRCLENPRAYPEMQRATACCG